MSVHQADKRMKLCYGAEVYNPTTNFHSSPQEKVNTIFIHKLIIRCKKLSFLLAKGIEDARQCFISFLHFKQFFQSFLSSSLSKICDFLFQLNSSVLDHLPKMSATDFEFRKLLGQGQYGRVYLAERKSNLYAVKVVNKDYVIGSSCEAKIARRLRNVNREKDTLQQLDHRFVVKCHFIFQSPAQLFFVMDFVQGGDLFQLLIRQGAMAEHEVKFFLAEIAAALDHLHSFDLIHRDLKPDNILLTVDGHVKLADFGFSRHIHNCWRSKSICGSYEYMAPEMFQQIGHGKASDWWSFGVLAYEMLHLEVSC